MGFIMINKGFWRAEIINISELNMKMMMEMCCLPLLLELYGPIAAVHRALGQ